jgi:hypothetical protein
MQRFWKLFPVFLLVLAFAPVTRAMPVQDDYAAPAQAAEVREMQGALVKVDTDNLTFTIKLENGEEVQLQYDSNTEVEDRDSGVQGLSDEAGTQLTVHYTEENGKRLATWIQIKRQDVTDIPG